MPILSRSSSIRLDGFFFFGSTPVGELTVCCFLFYCGLGQLCEAVGANRYPFPEDRSRQRSMNAEVGAQRPLPCTNFTRAQESAVRGMVEYCVERVGLEHPNACHAFG